MRVQWITGYVLGCLLVASAALGIVASVYAVSGAAAGLGDAIRPPPVSMATLRPALPAPHLLEWVQQRDHEARQRRRQAEVPPVPVMLQEPTSDEP